MKKNEELLLKMDKKNILNYSYAPNGDGVADQDDIALNYQLGFLPIFYYRIDF